MLDSPARADDRFRQLVELSPDTIFIGRDGLIEYANPAALQLVGAPTPDLVVGRSPLAFVAESSRPHVEFLIAEVLSGRPVTGVDRKSTRLNSSH